MTLYNIVYMIDGQGAANMFVLLCCVFVCVMC